MTGPLAVPLLTAADARAGDAAAVAAGGSWAGLMARASGHLARAIVTAGGHGYGLKVAVLTGKGNNGGDGWAAAHRLLDLGASPWVVAVPGLDVELSDEAASHRARWLRRGGRVSDGLAAVEAALRWCDVAADCLLGTGTSGAPRGEAGEACDALNAAGARGTTIVACDVPSGVGSDDGTAPANAVRADLTVTFGGPKRGLLLHPGSEHAGTVVVGELGSGFDPGSVAWQALTAAGAAPPPYAVGTDKRDRGVCLAVAGSVGSAGAAILVTRGLLAAGAGLTTLATPAHVQRVIAPVVPPAMTRPLRHTGAVVSAAAVDELDDLDEFDVVVAGPGLGHGDGTAAVVASLRERARRLVLDADALNVHRDDPGALADHAGVLVLTPHERELARIGGGHDGQDAWRHRAERVPTLAAELDATIVAKGPGTLVAAPDGRVWVTPLGSPALGSGGTGDVLAGVVGAAVAAAADDVPLAVARAVWWHALAGALAGRGRADRADADDVVAAIPDALALTDRLAALRPGWPLEGTPAAPGPGLDTVAHLVGSP